VLRVELSREQLALVAEHVAELTGERSTTPEPWLNVEAAARHLACPKSRLYALVSARRVPFHKDGSRVLFRASELDAWVEGGGARRP
jgi:excisionase family DNA binding protein